MRISLPGAKYQEDKQTTDFFEQAQERIKNLPGVVSVGATSRLALKGYRWTGDLTIEGRPPDLLELPQGCRFAPRCPLRFDRCDSIDPGLYPVGPSGRGAACLLQEAAP